MTSTRHGSGRMVWFPACAAPLTVPVVSRSQAVAASPGAARAHPKQKQETPPTWQSRSD